MTDSAPKMLDMIFDLEGGVLPDDYPFALWAALTHHLPALAKDERVGVLPLRLASNNEGMLLPKRAKLALRLPAVLADTATRLSGHRLHVSGGTLRLGDWKARSIQPYPTLHAQLVTGNSDEVLFMDRTNTQLDEMGITGKMICGRRRTLIGDQQTIHGYSLVLHDLTPEASLQLQYAGLGEGRRFGCGIFVPYKVISGLE